MSVVRCFSGVNPIVAFLDDLDEVSNECIAALNTAGRLVMGEPAEIHVKQKLERSKVPFEFGQNFVAELTDGVIVELVLFHDRGRSSRHRERIVGHVQSFV